MRVAWVTPYLPEPATSGGAIRQQRLAGALAAHAEVHLFARGEPWEKRRLKSEELRRFASAWLGRDYWPRAGGAVRSARVRRGSPQSLYRAVAELHERSPLDLVVVAHSWAASGASSLGVPWLLDEHNIESRYFAGLYRARGRSEKSVATEIAEIERWERRVWASATALSCVCDADAKAIASHRTAGSNGETDPFLRDPIVVSNGADLVPLAKTSIDPRREGILFVGSMHHEPNVDAATRLTKRVLPRVWSELPEVSLTIVGGPVPGRLLAARRALPKARRERVRLAGIVPDVRPYLRGAKVYANPLCDGAGSSLKIVEALASGVPLVSTELGARGFGLNAAEHYVRAESDEEHARAIVRVLCDDDFAAALSRAGQKEAERYGWDALGEKFVELARRAASTGSTRHMH